jgi:pyruvate phosphate dikinase (EC 2.7.9.1)
MLQAGRLTCGRNYSSANSFHPLVKAFVFSYFENLFCNFSAAAFSSTSLRLHFLRLARPNPRARYSPSSWGKNRMASTTNNTSFVYSFGAKKADGNGEMKELLGGKGANLAEMAKIGLPVPSGFTITTEVCTFFYKNKKNTRPG